MRIHCRLFAKALHAAAFSLLAASLVYAQQPSNGSGIAPLFLASGSAAALSSASSNSSSSRLSNASLDLNSAAFDRSQPPPRRYGRPHYSDKNSNPDGSPRYTLLGGVGAGLPVGNTHQYETPGYAFQVGGGRNFNRNFAVILEFDYDHFGLQAATIANQEAIYNYCPPAAMAANQCPSPIANLDGNNHVWSVSVDPTFTLATQGWLGAYAVAGAGFYHKVTNFNQPALNESCDLYGCYFYQVDESVAHYTSNAPGFSGGLGVTCKLSQVSTARIYLEARYVVVLDQQRYGYTAQNVATTSYTGYDAYPANSNRTTYIPITFGIRF